VRERERERQRVLGAKSESGSFNSVSFVLPLQLGPLTPSRRVKKQRENQTSKQRCLPLFRSERYRGRYRLLACVFRERENEWQRRSK
jgi:hypothetical protein